MNDDFRRQLKRGKSEDMDSATFRAYRSGWISLEECKHQVFENNRMGKNVREKTTTEEFKEWLKGLGWDE